MVRFVSSDYRSLWVVRRGAQVVSFAREAVRCREMSIIMGGCDMAKVKKGKKTGGGVVGGGAGLHEQLAAMGIDLVKETAELLADPATSPRIKADLLKDLLNYQYSKQKAVQVDMELGAGITFNLDLAGRE